jgi:RHS repeat-associated protein
MRSRQTQRIYNAKVAGAVLATALTACSPVFVAAATAAATQATAQNQCMRPGTEAPCLPGGLTSTANTEPTLNLGAGNPVHLATGHKVHIENDGPFRRHYHASNNGPGTVLGRAWSMDWETRLSISGHRATILHADASRTHFIRSGKNAAYTSPHGRLEQAGESWLWRTENGQTLEFNGTGRLTRLHNAHLDLTVLRYREQGNPLNTLAHTLVLNNQKITLQYQILGGRPLLSAMQLGSGTVRYRYTLVQAGRTPRLHQVNQPNGTAHRYHYALQPALHTGGLTGIDKQLAPNTLFQPWRHWTLDKNGRVSLLALHSFAQAKGHTQYLAFEYTRLAAPGVSGITHVRQANGKHTRFLFKWVNGRARLEAVSGAPCPGCAAPGTRAHYTRYGELKHINGLDIHRDRQGRIRQLNPQHSGWPDLQLHFNGKGYQQRWHTSLTGNTVLSRTPGGLPSRRAFANGHAWAYQYDGAGRPIKITASGPDNEPAVTTLRWHGNRLMAVLHPNERLEFEYDQQGRLISQQSTRPLQNTTLTLQSRFAYNKQNQRTRHDLPEGGRLHYTWSGNRLQRLVWENAKGRRKIVVQAPPLPEHAAGYRYGNGLEATTTIGPGFAHQTLQARTNTQGRLLVWQQRYRLNEQGHVTKEQITGRDTHRWHYKYDHKQRLIGALRHTGKTAAQTHHNQTQWYAWHDSGALLARKYAGNTKYQNIQRDPSGLPTRVNSIRLRYGPDRRLKSVGIGRTLERTLEYRHDAFGRLIEKHTSTHGASPDNSFWYLDGQRVAERGFSPQPLLSRRYLYAHHVPVGFIQYSHRYPHGQLYFIHSDLLGAPRLVTDANQKVMWLAHYWPTGRADIIVEHVQLNLRAPGQHVDPDTGWHDNLHRTYDPQAGHYLEPDPLGPFPGGDALGYAMQQPRRYIDPLGLMLFAFDGTRNNAQTQSNVWKLAQRYEDGPVFYRAGPGNPYETDWDALTAYSAPDIINKQWQNLLGSLENEPVSPEKIQPIDILGYSRGSAMARHFANQVSQHTRNNLFSFHDPLRGLVSACVDLRFLGLFDTVAQFGVGGSRNNEFNMTIDDSWQWVAHAIALHEHRWLFPLMVVGQNHALNSIEAPFVGAHADIGGGIVIDEHGQSLSHGDLSDVSLNWMLWQARAASLQFSDSLNDSIISSPIVHDARSPILRTIQNGDRSIENADGSKHSTYQDHDPRLGRVTREQVESFIQRLPGWKRRAGSEVGHVDMQGYAAWLYDALGWQAPMPSSPP